ncbi:DEAD/DEAH box helicase [Halorubellus sp. JP-L1]|uniref:DEAD/DEAH box helicase family protein n=1 Tax=Halorubellus sp. JP-L1 TaxID=2715753 RepID=UPI0014083BDB|nr:DEAD/DEAH box helicase [Halorubellus sp. JP-L1]
MTVTLRYENGSVRVDGDVSDAVRSTLPGVESDPRSGGLRAPAFRYAAIRDALSAADVAVDDRGLDLDDVPNLETSYELRSYQEDAVDAWEDAGRRGNLELPTGSGKTVIALAAMAALSTPTLVVVPTIDLLEQWRTELEAEFDVPIGQFGGGEQRIEPITVSTYDSAYLKAEDVGDRFGFVVFDEVHHLGGEGYRDAARLLAAPARMGLTATFERPDDAHEVVAELVGPLVHRLSVDDLAGEHLAPYDVKRVEVELTPEERERYEANQETFTDYLATSGIQMRSGSDYQELVKRSGTDPEAREALLAKERARRIMLGSEAKVAALGDVLDRHRDDRVIVFTAHNDFAYEVAERFLVPVVTHQTSASERREILDRFREGRYSRIVSSNVLDEGVDVPEANVGVVCSGSGSEREFTQRLGRILRPRDGKTARLYEIVSADTAEERVASRRR